MRAKTRRRKNKNQDLYKNLCSVNLTSAQEAFIHLKHWFPSLPVLAQLGPSLQFTVEVDASGSGVDAVLSQRVIDKMQPCAFFSHRLFPKEHSYNVGDQELPAMKLALEQWRDWLEGGERLCDVWTGICPNSNMIKHIMILFHPGFGILSQMLSPASSQSWNPTHPMENELILRARCITGSLTGEMESLVGTAKQKEQEGLPIMCLFFKILPADSICPVAFPWLV